VADCNLIMQVLFQRRHMLFAFLIMEEVGMEEYIKPQTLPQEVLLWTTGTTAAMQHIPPMTPTQDVVGCSETSHE